MFLSGWHEGDEVRIITDDLIWASEYDKDSSPVSFRHDNMNTFYSEFESFDCIICCVFKNRKPLGPTLSQDFYGSRMPRAFQNELES